MAEPVWLSQLETALGEPEPMEPEAASPLEPGAARDEPTQFEPAVGSVVEEAAAAAAPTNGLTDGWWWRKENLARLAVCLSSVPCGVCAGVGPLHAIEVV